MEVADHLESLDLLPELVEPHALEEEVPTLHPLVRDLALGAAGHTPGPDEPFQGAEPCAGRRLAVEPVGVDFR
ncbi:hypothetical protein D3C74_406370 [compost metagenome]